MTKPDIHQRHSNYLDTQSCPTNEIQNQVDTKQLNAANDFIPILDPWSKGSNRKNCAECR